MLSLGLKFEGHMVNVVLCQENVAGSSLTRIQRKDYTAQYDPPQEGPNDLHEKLYRLQTDNVLLYIWDTTR